MVRWPENQSDTPKYPGEKGTPILSRMSTRHEVCPVEELPPGERTIVEVSGLSIGVFNVDGDFYGLLNTCPHQLADLCRGTVGGLVTSSAVGEYDFERDGQVIRCPRHKWAFDITTGESVFNPHLATRTFDVEAEPHEEDISEYGTSLEGDAPPVETFEVDVEDEVVVVYV